MQFVRILKEFRDVQLNKSEDSFDPSILTFNNWFYIFSCDLKPKFSEYSTNN